MTAFKYGAIRLMFEALWASQLPWLLRLLSGSKGVIFTLHRVIPGQPADFSPNSILQIRPDFFEYVIERVEDLGLDIVSLDEAIRRIKDPKRTRKFVVFTFDDGYRDNREFALPIMRKHGVPFTIYLPTGLVDGEGEVWWQALEDILAKQDAIVLESPEGRDYLATATVQQKNEVFAGLYRKMRRMPEPQRVAFIRELANQYGLDLKAHCRSLIMNWQELATFARDPLCTIGAHTVHHYELKKLSEKDVRNEIAQSVSILEVQFGKRPAHFSYPIGGVAAAGEREFAIARELGLVSAVTTRPGGISRVHRDRLHRLPRVSLNGMFQSRRYVDVYTTGPIFSMIGARANRL